MRIATDDGVGLAVEVAGRRSGARAACTGSAARRRTSPTTSTRSRRGRTVVTFDHRGHGESDEPADPCGLLARPPRADTSWPSPTRVGARPVPAPRPLDGRDGRAPGRARRARPGRRARDHEHRRRAPRGPRSRPRRRRLPQLALDDWDALKAVLDEARALGTAAYQRLLAERRRVSRTSASGSGRALAPAMWAALGPQIAREPDDARRRRRGRAARRW